MLKRKYGDRSDWERVFTRNYSQSYIETAEFEGYITLLEMIKVTEPLSVIYNEKSVCIANDGYSWLQQFPQEKHHSVTTMFNADGEIIQWYIDICFRNGLENGVPWMDDLYLDLVLLPSGEMIEKDAEEIEEALAKREINQSMYDLAWNEMNNIKNLIKNNSFDLIKLSNYHMKLLSDSNLGKG